MYINPQLNRLQNSRSELRQFGGLNETYACSEAEYQSGLNFSSRDFPALSTRIPRQKMWEVENLHGVYHLNGLLSIHGTTLDYTPDDATEPTVTIENKLTDTEKQLAGMGTSVLIWPDKKIFDTATGDLKNIEAEWEGIDVTFELCDSEGTVYDIPAGSAGIELPDSGLTDGKLFLLAKNEDNLYAGSSTLQQYSVSLENWNEVTLDYCKISCEGIGANFEQWDTVTMSNVAQVIRDNIGSDLEEDKIIYAKDADSIVVQISEWEKATFHWAKYVQNKDKIQRTTPDGVTTEIESTEENIKLERNAPDMDYLCENDNRVWGCSSGENVIYACKLGDPTNWYSYRGIASDAYAVTVGSDGAFTGAASCMGYALFFKENAMHKIYGSKPSDYQVTNLRCRGVAKNAYKSLCVINETLYYLSPEGVMSWGGGLPEKVSEALARDTTVRVTRAVGGQLDGRYYLYTENRNKEPRLLVYDTERGMWHEESPSGQEMASTGRQLYLYDGSYMWAVDPSREMDTKEDGTESNLEYNWISGDMGLDVPDDKYISRVTIRLDASEESQINVSVSFDGEDWQKMAEKHTSEKRQRIDLPVIPHRYDTMRIRLNGKGAVTLRSIAFTMSKAGGNISQKTK